VADPAHVPTDEEFLAYLHDQLKDDEWVGIQKRFTADSDLVKEAKRYIAEGSFAEDQLNDLVEALYEATTPAAYFRGKFIDSLRHAALKMIGKHDESLDRVLVACMPTRILNAAAWSTPRGGALIVLDQGVIAQLGTLVRAFVAYHTWEQPEPYCHDHSKAAFGRTIQYLAAYSISGDMNWLKRIETYDCPSLRLHDPVVEYLSVGIELFIMLHEYGHIILGHLSTAAVTPMKLAAGNEVTILVNSVDQEFQADEFAFKTYASTGVKPWDVALSAGLMMHFFHLGEMLAPAPTVKTHPPSLERWSRIRAMADPKQHPRSWANYLDDDFAPLAATLRDVVA